MSARCKDIFAVQDEIRQQIVFALKVKLTEKSKHGLSVPPPITWRPMTTICADGSSFAYDERDQCPGAADV